MSVLLIIKLTLTYDFQKGHAAACSPYRRFGGTLAAIKISELEERNLHSSNKNCGTL